VVGVNLEIIVKSLIRIFFVLPIAVIVIMLAVANRHAVTLSFNPLAPDDPATAFDVPVFWLVFACVAMGVILGGIAVWFTQGRFRRAARENRHEAAKWRAENERHREKLAALSAEGTAALPSSTVATLPRNAA